MTTQMQSQQKTSFLTNVLRSDGVFATISGVVTLAAANPIAAILDLENPVVLMILGAVLLMYGGTLLYFAGRELHNQAIAQAAIVLNILWVLASYAGLLAGWFPVNTAGKWTIALVAEVVLIFAILEIIALRRIGRNN